MSNSKASLWAPFSAAEQEKLKEVAINSTDIRHYAAIGASSVDAMVQLKKSSVDARRKCIWFPEAGIHDFDEMARLVKAGVNGLRAHWFHQIGIADPDEMISLTRAKPRLDKETIQGFAAHGFHTALPIIRLDQAGISVRALECLLPFGLRTEDQLLQFANASKLNGIDPWDFQRLTHKLDELGELGCRLRSVHAAPRNTTHAVRRCKDLIPFLEELSDDALKTLVYLAEEHEKVTVKEVRAFLAVVS